MTFISIQAIQREKSNVRFIILDPEISLIEHFFLFPLARTWAVPYFKFHAKSLADRRKERVLGNFYGNFTAIDFDVTICRQDGETRMSNTLRQKKKKKEKELGRCDVTSSTIERIMWKVDLRDEHRRLSSKQKFLPKEPLTVQRATVEFQRCQAFVCLKILNYFGNS